MHETKCAEVLLKSKKGIQKVIIEKAEDNFIYTLKVNFTDIKLLNTALVSTSTELGVFMSDVSVHQMDFSAQLFQRITPIFSVEYKGLNKVFQEVLQKASEAIINFNDDILILQTSPPSGS